MKKKSFICEVFKRLKKTDVVNVVVYYDFGNPAKPISYKCCIFDYTIYIYSGCDYIEIYKSKTVANLPQLYYYYFCRGRHSFVTNMLAGPIGNFYSIEELNQDDLARLVNKNWGRAENFEHNRRNYELVKYFKNQVIKRLESHKQIIWDNKTQKYISYDFAMFRKDINKKGKSNVRK